MAKAKKEVKKTSLKKKIQAKKEAIKLEKPGKRGRPRTKKPVIGWEVGSKEQSKIASEYASAQKLFDTIGESVSKFAFEAAPKSAMDAIREIIKLQSQLKSMGKTIRVIKKNMKPKYAPIVIPSVPE